MRVGFGFVGIIGDKADDHSPWSHIASELDLWERFPLISRCGSLKCSSPMTLNQVSESLLIGSRLLDYNYVRPGRPYSRWLRVYRLHQVLLLMLQLLLLLMLLLLFMWEVSEVVEHVSWCLLLVVCRMQLGGDAVVLAWNSSCWNRYGALLLWLFRLIRNMQQLHQLHQVLLLMLLLLLLLLLLLVWQAWEVVEHVSRCLLLVVCWKQLGGHSLVLAWNSSCWNGYGVLLLWLVRLIRNVQQLNLRIEDGQHVL